MSITSSNTFERYEFYDIVTDEDYRYAEQFLNKYYYKNSDASFKLNYSADHIKWLTTITEEEHEGLCFALVFKGTKIFVGFIMGTVVKYVLNDEEIQMTEVNLLCVHPNLRSQKYALYTINEFVRRVGLLGYSEAIYTGSHKLGYPSKYIGTAQYYHRPLDLDYLLAVDFTSIWPYPSKKKKKTALRLPANSKYLKPLKLEDINIAYDLLSSYVPKYKLYPIMSLEFFIKTFYNNNYVLCYLCYDDNDKPVDVISYYVLPYKHIESETIVRAVSLYYYTNHSNNLETWIKNIMIIARNNGHQLFNALNIMETAKVFEDLKFEEGTGILHYLVYKHKVNEIKSDEIGKILF
jgi:glycylpeptide N-tetradecanoyltransferase